MGSIRDNATAARPPSERLETPAVGGYRSGMTATGMIAQRLARVYDVASGVPGNMGAVLRAMDGVAKRR